MNGQARMLILALLAVTLLTGVVGITIWMAAKPDRSLSAASADWAAQEAIVRDYLTKDAKRLDGSQPRFIKWGPHMSRGELSALARKELHPDVATVLEKKLPEVMIRVVFTDGSGRERDDVYSVREGEVGDQMPCPLGDNWKKHFSWKN